MENKNHWYDGKFYDIFVAPNQDAAFKNVLKLIGNESVVLDAGCGTGRFTRHIIENCKRIDAIDLSERNIKIAKKNFPEEKYPNVKFHHKGIETFLADTDTRYDFALMSYVIHEVGEKHRINILKQLAERCEYIILVDYLIPRPKGMMNFLNGIVEFVAGKEHYTNFKSYERNNGLHGLIESAGLTLESEILNNPPTSHIVKVRK